MKQNGLGKLYDRLTPEERFRLDVMATARGDMEESELLTRTCPRHSYTMNDIGFADRWHAAKEMAVLTHMSLVSTVERLQLVEGFGLIVSALANLADLEAEGGMGEKPGAEGVRCLAREMPELTEELKRSIAERGFSVWAAFKGFCAEEMGLEAGVLLGALAEPMADGVRELEEIAERLEVEPDAETVEDCAATLRESWQRRISRG
jgi:hypothetical protein